ncbi:uncharacterized protein DUF2627 [Paenibacillus cellulosilyticus]|uniref:Uncharacterized protein DUF2627 n=1 Tax=Paenibacillus cellulosilyticus TaxID=375489 RepID=A0A2V2Z0B3_9BACL|nr:DUF2627 domain-containing protein [Paenibacillus cellulosilyticus]PWW05638.1 uncharacterized protein DUF2627 [Paenibacillus cellulosilyticus]QKS45333.1 DUF2627 domain-containing protein [Paenibacillus cellulosilyticus]
MKAQPSVIAARFIAILLLVIPGLLATYGFLRMKDALYDYFVSYGDEVNAPSFAWLTFIIGFILFAIGVGFIGGWIFFRDRKHNYVAPRFRQKRSRPPKPTTRPGS